MKAVLFDLDETILDRSASLKDFVSWQTRGMLRSEVRDENLFTKRFIQLDANGTVWKDEVYQTLVSEFAISGWSVRELLTSYELCFSGFCKPKKGEIEAIKTIHKMGKRFALVSNGRSPFQERNFNSLGISHLFDAVIVSEAVGLRKPDPAIFKLACKRLGVEPRTAIFVGDNPLVDIRGAKKAGMYGIYIPSHYGDKCDEADVTCEVFQALPNMIENAH